MQMQERTLEGKLVVKVLETHFGADKAVSFKDNMTRHLKAGHKHLVLDLSDVKFIDSSGLGAILSVLKTIGKDGELAICGLTEPVANMFKLTRMDRVFTIHKTAETAAAAAAS